MMADSGYPKFTVASTTTGGLNSFMPPSTSRNRAGSPLMMRPDQRRLFEIAGSVEYMGLLLVEGALAAIVFLLGFVRLPAVGVRSRKTVRCRAPQGRHPLLSRHKHHGDWF